MKGEIEGSSRERTRSHTRRRAVRKDRADVDIPEELHRREARLEKIRWRRPRSRKKREDARRAVAHNAAGQREVSRDESVDPAERAARAREPTGASVLRRSSLKDDDDDDDDADLPTGGTARPIFRRIARPQRRTGSPSPSAAELHRSRQPDDDQGWRLRAGVQRASRRRRQHPTHRAHAVTNQHQTSSTSSRC